ncbi:hypothetical protein PJ985_18795 [Streptomyces sp. ACA25]|uniref:hypothetical protein n=1 Tax=Streptomyces sp. ACA25 TaxID=3022596 RepID=UPI00230714E3|nr:hypothetical protein [Streptomyces sp. ACA25]MDB1089607.1 hypothetical protein [Streptomyces sp. ACA25]
MERDGQLELYGLVATRLKEAHGRVRVLGVSEEVRQGLVRRVLVISAAARHDLPGAARRLDQLMKDIDEGRVLPGPPAGSRSGTP